MKRWQELTVIDLEVSRRKLVHDAKEEENVEIRGFGERKEADRRELVARAFGGNLD